MKTQYSIKMHNYKMAWNTQTTKNIPGQTLSKERRVFHNYRTKTTQNTSMMYRKPDWIVQCFTSPPTQYRLYGRRFLQVKRPNQQYQGIEGDATKKRKTTQRT